MNVHIIQPHRPFISARHLLSLNGLVTEFRKNHFNVSMRRKSAALLPKVRSFQATEFLEEAGVSDDYLALTLDDDMGIPFPAEVVEMCHEAFKNKCIVGANYVTKEVQGMPTACLRSGSTTYFKGGALKLGESVATGVMAVHVSVYRKLAKKLPTYNDGIIPFYAMLVRDNDWLGEDVSFCRLAKENGIPVFCDTRVRIGHLGEHEFHLEDLAHKVVYKDQLVLKLKEVDDRSKKV